MIVTDTNRTTFVTTGPVSDLPLVRSFNLRTGDVVLAYADVISALGFTPAPEGSGGLDIESLPPAGTS